MKEKILREFKESISVKEKFIESSLKTILEVSNAIANTFNEGNKLILFGNGGSATDASHLAAEFVNRFRSDINR
jgi:D-sedoheptulose 7-phosphate isomerase